MATDRKDSTTPHPTYLSAFEIIIDGKIGTGLVFLYELYSIKVVFIEKH